jgi:hypothetical protein
LQRAAVERETAAGGAEIGVGRNRKWPAPGFVDTCLG